MSGSLRSIQNNTRPAYSANARTDEPEAPALKLRNLVHRSKPASDQRKLAARLLFQASQLQNLRLMLVFIALLPCTSGCARYQVGAQSLYSPDITTVYVPMIESKSLRRYLGERLTEAVVKEIEKQTPYKVVDADDADSILTARLVAETKKIKTSTRYDDGRENIISFQIEATWIDRRGEIIRRDLALPVAPEFASLLETGNYIPEIGQSVSTAQQTAIQRTAEQIVAMMEVPW